MRRREFLSLVGAMTVWPIRSKAQSEMPVIGHLYGGFQDKDLQQITAFKQGLLDTGFVEGKNLMIEYRWANAQYDRLPELAADLARHRVAVIATDTPVAAIAAKNATTSIPVVFGLGSDPVRDGLVVSLNRPGGNVTGATSSVICCRRSASTYSIVSSPRTISLLCCSTQRMQTSS